MHYRMNIYNNFCRRILLCMHFYSLVYNQLCKKGRHFEKNTSDIQPDRSDKQIEKGMCPKCSFRKCWDCFCCICHSQGCIERTSHLPGSYSLMNINCTCCCCIFYSWLRYIHRRNTNMGLVYIHWCKLNKD